MQDATPTPATLTPAKPRRCGLATAGFVLGLLAFCTCFLGPLLGLPAVLCSHAGLAQVKQSKGTLTGRRSAIAGLVMVGFADDHAEHAAVTPGTSLEQVAPAKAWIVPKAVGR